MYEIEHGSNRYEKISHLKTQEQAKAKLIESGKLYGENHLNEEQVQENLWKDKIENICESLENKGWSSSDNLERIESLKAEKRMKVGKTDPIQIFGEGDKHKTESSNIVEEKLGVGSGEQYRKEKFISDNRSILKPEDFADWDEGRLSINEIYKTVWNCQS